MASSELGSKIERMPDQAALPGLLVPQGADDARSEDPPPPSTSDRRTEAVARGSALPLRREFADIGRAVNLRSISCLFRCRVRVGLPICPTGLIPDNSAIVVE
jgi:hypothetical protein